MFYRLLHCCTIENVWEIWPIKIDFGWPNAEIGRKIASGQLLFLARDATIYRYIEYRDTLGSDTVSIHI